ncbi:hypothetical protein H2201_004000 [Coniosporium apollinis]|uniref:Uncharacterized protein n=1 Tax=Coniosporium apollinis TaxID=61459 RepID=A0ABQ9NW25_9PEZI|nr:hypothetical protein H2201_004000 [Coniosporium apollinis]
MNGTTEIATVFPQLDAGFSSIFVADDASKGMLDKPESMLVLGRSLIDLFSQWDNSEHAGFSTGELWQRVNDTYPKCNAATQVGVKGGVIQYWTFDPVPSR